jgi:competence protein ComEA
MHATRHLIAGLTLLASGAVLAEPPVDINTASPEVLAAAIDGVGTARAQAIVAEREANGPFRSVDDLARVQGIGDRIVAANRERITAGAPEGAK